MLIYPCIGLLFIAVASGAYLFFEKILSSGAFENKIQKSLTRNIPKNYLAMQPESIITISICLAAFLFLIGFFLAEKNIVAGITLGFVLAAFGIFIPHFILTRITEKRLQKLNEELPPTLEMLANSIRAGLTLLQAIERNIERLPDSSAQEFKIVLYECKIGKSLSEALNNFADRTGLMDARLTAISAELSLKHGGNLSLNFQNLAKLIRERYLFQREVSALTAEGRMQALVMTILPFAIILIMTLIRKTEMLEFLSSSIGIASVVTVFIMQLAAYIWINKIVSIKV